MNLIQITLAALLAAVAQATYSCETKDSIVYCSSTTENWFYKPPAPVQLLKGKGKKQKDCGPTDLLDDAGFKPRECERATASLALTTSIPGPKNGPLGAIGVVSPPFTQMPDTRLENNVAPASSVLPSCLPGGNSSYAYYQSTQLPGKAIVSYVTRFASVGPYKLQLPDKTGAIDFFLDGFNEAEFTLGLLQEDGTEAVNTFTVVVNGATCNTYVAIYHKRRGELKWISISSKVPQALVIAHPIRIAKKAGKRHLL